MTLNDILKFYKTTYKFNKETGISSGNFNNWKKKGYVPISMQYRIQKLTNNELKVDDVYL